MVAPILDQFGRPMSFSSAQRERLFAVRAYYQKRFERLQASFDATREGAQFSEHWGKADHLSPHAAARFDVRKKLRSRSRFEVIENNPYLKGMALTLCNDFVGSGPKMQITDQRLSKAARRFIEQEYQDWQDATKYRQKLWRLRMARTVDGEGFKKAYISDKLEVPVKLNYQVLECDHCTSEGIPDARQSLQELNDVDGVKLDKYGEPSEYFLLDEHPGARFSTKQLEGRWYPANQITHWFRQDRGWLRGIPETTPSLPLCALLRRYTLATVKAAEVGSSLTGVIESEAPPGTNQFDENGEDDPFDTIPIEHGMFTTLPWGTHLKPFDAKQPLPAYDMFVGAVLREIARPLLVPYNMASGSSRESNMASAVVDTHIYKEGQKADRLLCNENVCCEDFARWYRWARLIPGYLPAEVQQLPGVPRHVYRWDKVGLDHTDPGRVASAMQIAHEAGFITDRDVQEEHYNRNVEDWQQDVRDQIAFREQVGLPIVAGAQGGGPPADPPRDDPESE